MKRVFLVFLAFLLFVPVLLIPAGASEEYLFEYVNPNIMLLDDSFVAPVFEGYYFVYPGFLPEGLYSASFVVADQPEDEVITFSLSDDLDIVYSFLGSDLFWDFDCYISVFFNGEYIMDYDCGVMIRYDNNNDSTILCILLPKGLEPGSILDFFPFEDVTSALVLSPVRSDSPFAVFLSDCSSVISSGLSTVSNICSVIVNDGFLLLCAGFLFLGGCVGLSGRLLSRD